MNTDVRDIKITLMINGQKRHPTAVNMVMGIGMYPVVNVTHHGDQEAYNKAIDVTTEDVCKEMGGRQAEMFKERKEANATLSITDGDGGSIDFKGYITAPNYSYSQYNVDLSDTILPTYAKLDSLDLSCYQIAPLDLDSIRMVPGLPDVANVSELFYKRADAMLKLWEKHRSSYAKIETTFETQSKESQHRINKLVITHLEELTTTSTAVFGWDELDDWLKRGPAPGYDSTVINRIDSLLRTSSGSFFTTICQFCEEYQCLYVPSWDRPGLMINRNLLFDEPLDYETAPVAMNIVGGCLGMFPVRYITVSPSCGQFDLESKMSTNRFIAFPEINMKQGGTAIRVAGPPWHPPWLAMQEVNKKKAPVQKEDTAHTVKLLEASKDGIEDDRKLYNTKSDNILKAWAKSVYFWQSLGPSRVQMQVPLDLDVTVGRRYTVTNKKGKTLFAGFLQQVSHNIACNADSGRASSDLVFSHVELGDFKLPGKDS